MDRHGVVERPDAVRRGSHKVYVEAVLILVIDAIFRYPVGVRIIAKSEKNTTQLEPCEYWGAPLEMETSPLRLRLHRPVRP